MAIAEYILLLWQILRHGQCLAPMPRKSTWQATLPNHQEKSFQAPEEISHGVRVTLLSHSSAVPSNVVICDVGVCLCGTTIAATIPAGVIQGSIEASPSRCH